MSTQTDDFNTADSNTLGHNLTWTELLGGTFHNTSNQANVFSTPARARAEADVSTSDHETQADVTSQDSTGGTVSVNARYSSSADTCYALRITLNATGTYVLLKITAGSSATLATQNATAPTPTYTAKLRATGGATTALTGYINGSSVITYSDSSSPFTTGTRGGLTGATKTGNTMDNFSIADVVTADSYPAYVQRPQVYEREEELLTY